MNLTVRSEVLSLHQNVACRIDRDAGDGNRLRTHLKVRWLIGVFAFVEQLISVKIVIFQLL